MNPFIEIVDILVGLYITIILLRFFLQYFRADFYNPLSQLVVKATDPLIKPIRKIVPGFGGIDVSSLLLAYIVILLKLLFIFAISAGTELNIIYLVLYSIVDLVQSIIRLFLFMILVRVIISWISPGGYSPIISVIGQISEPVVAKFRKMLPPSQVIDLAPMVASLFLFFIYKSINYWGVPLIIQIAY